MKTEPKIRLSGYIDVPAVDLAVFKGALPAHIRLSRAEPGCEHFSISPVPGIAGRFAVEETFQSQAAFELHTARTRKSDWWQKTRHIPRNLKITGE